MNKQQTEKRLTGFRYDVKANFKLTKLEILILMDCSETHYDGLCRQQSKEGGCIYRWRNRLDDTGIAKVEASIHELDITCKILEQLDYSPKYSMASFAERAVMSKLVVEMKTLLKSCIAERDSLYGDCEKSKGELVYDSPLWAWVNYESDNWAVLEDTQGNKVSVYGVASGPSPNKEWMLMCMAHRIAELEENFAEENKTILFTRSPAEDPRLMVEDK